MEVHIRKQNWHKGDYIRITYCSKSKIIYIVNIRWSLSKKKNNRSEGLHLQRSEYNNTVLNEINSTSV